MPVVPADRRLQELAPLGLSTALLQMTAGQQIHPLFSFRCETPPYFAYHGAHVPDGPPFLPLWDCGDCVTGVWKQTNKLEFIKFSIEAPEEYKVLAHTEQGLWATVFVDLYEDEDGVDIKDFREPARLVGFRFLDMLLTAHDQENQRTYSEHHAFLKQIVSQIDGLESIGT